MKIAREIRKGSLAEIMGRVGMNELELLRDSSPPVWNGLVCEIDRIISAKLEPIRNRLIAYKVHTLRGDHEKAARVVVDALAMLEEES